MVVVIADRQHGQKNHEPVFQNYIVLYSKQILNLHHDSIKFKPTPELACRVESLRHDENGNNKSFGIKRILKLIQNTAAFIFRIGCGGFERICQISQPFLP